MSKNYIQISIPYGSIKSMAFTLIFVLGMNISIPYGSIKRTYAPARPLHSLISIPYGSIKRTDRKTDWTVYPIFQFLMVQLKVLKS